MGHFETSLPVPFGQVDYAGIMFYPRFFENFHAVFEDMFSTLLGVPYMSILKDRRIGFPTVRIETEYRRPFRFGEPMRLRIQVEGTGRTSIRFRYQAFNGEEAEPSVEAHAVVVVTDLDSFETVPIPDDIMDVLDRIRIDTP